MLFLLCCINLQQQSKVTLYKMDRGRSFLVTILMICLFLIGLPSGQGYKDPRDNPNLSPFDKWESAYQCLQNVSTSCGDKYQLTQVGWVNVTANATSDYCKGGCSEHTLIVLRCLDDVMRGEFRFESKQTVEDIKYTITQGCLNGFTGQAVQYSTSSSGSTIQMSYPLSLLAWLSISYIIMSY